MKLLRLVTIHPALVHYALGTIPLLVLAYAVARWRRSERWTFVGDVTLWITAALALVTGAFGFVSFFVLDWPAGISPWQWLHLGFGAAFAIGLCALAIVRARARSTEPRAGKSTLAAAIGIAALSVVTGWIGGEVLVFRSGMAVQAAGEGAFAPPLHAPPATPTSVMDAMHAIRPSWGAITTSLGAMIVDRPDDRGFATIAEEAGRIERAGAWLRDEAPKTLKKRPGGGAPTMGVGGGPPASDEAEPEKLARWGDDLQARAKALREAAENRDVRAVTKAAGRMQAACTGCHDELRWKH